MGRGTGGKSEGQELSLHEWATLPLHRVVVTAQVDGEGRLDKVGEVAAKAAAAVATEGIRVFAVCAAQLHEIRKQEGALLPVGAESVADLARQIHGKIGDQLYGPVVPLPGVLTRQETPDPQEPAKSFDYRAAGFQPFAELDDLVLQALRAEPDGITPGDPADGEIRKDAAKGYLHVLGTAACGKTSWALDWVRQSLGEVSARSLPRLAGWYFARRDGDREYRDEVAALQNLISLARRRLDVLPDDGSRLLLDEAEARQHRDGTGDRQDLLRRRFNAALHTLAGARPPTPAQPMVFLIDGGDEMWGVGADPYQTWDFPGVLPKVHDLPEHVYIVLLSRPGPHMEGFHDKSPLLRYRFTEADVAKTIRRHLAEQAAALERRFPANEASALLRDEELQGHLIAASGSAFGYVTLLLRQWWPQGEDEPDVGRLRQWQKDPGTLPQGIYGLRAYEFMSLRQSKTEARQDGMPDWNDQGMGLAQALALVTQLRWPLRRRDFVALLYPGASRSPEAWRLDALLGERGASWLTDTRAGEPMRFGHQSLEEVALAAWRLEWAGRDVNYESLAGEARALATERAGEALPDGCPLTEEERRQADAQLHARLAGGRGQAKPRRWADRSDTNPARPWVAEEDAPPAPAWAYDLVWGPWHALTAARHLPEDPDNARAIVLGRDARALLINAPYLQSTLRAEAALARARGVAPEATALRDAYIQADHLPGDDPERPLRQRVESALLHWHRFIADGALQVGTLLWNLLGADDRGRDHAEAWKASLDRPALITSLPGRPADLDRQIPARAAAVTPCGHWLVTSDGTSKTEVWDLRQGWHRAIVIKRLDWALGRTACAAAEGLLLGIGGIDPDDEKNLLLVVIDLATGEAVRARYAGHQTSVTSVSLQCQREGDRLRWALASGSDDGTVGLLLRDTGQVEADARQSADAKGRPVTGALARYSGHRRPVTSVSLHGEREGDRLLWALASGSYDDTVGLLVRDTGQVAADARQSAGDAPVAGALARYAAHHGTVTSVSLHGQREDGRLLWGLASGSGDDTVGLLVRDTGQVEDDARQSAGGRPVAGALACYDGHDWLVTSVSLQCQREDGRLLWALASGSWDDTVGLLLRDTGQVEDDARQSAGGRPVAGALARYAGHHGTVTSVSLHCEREDGRTLWVVASGSMDGTIGLLLRDTGQVSADVMNSARGLVTPGALFQISDPYGEVAPRLIDPPAAHGDQKGHDTSMHWFGCNVSVAAIWAISPGAGRPSLGDDTSVRPILAARMVCPHFTAGFKVMDFAQAPDGIHYAVAGAIGNDVAILPLELFRPTR